MKRMNLGAGSIQPDGWINVDRDSDLFEEADGHYLDVASRNFKAVIEREKWTQLDYIVCNHMLSDIGHHDLVPALRNIRSMLKDGGVLRILVPDILAAFAAWAQDDEAWFPQDARTGSIDAKFCTFITWFGESKSVFDHAYLRELLLYAGFADVSLDLDCGETTFGSFVDGITDLDDRCTEALIVEARR